jgi:hypothetical protein
VSHRRKEEHGKKLRGRSCGKTEIGGEAWLSGNPLKVETFYEEEEENLVAVICNFVLIVFSQLLHLELILRKFHDLFQNRDLLV